MTDTTSSTYARHRIRSRGDVIEMLGRALAVGQLNITTHTVSRRAEPALRRNSISANLVLPENW